jgi:TENA/THI-4/PQQC family
MKSGAWSEEEFLERLHGVGAQAYHHLHPFHIRMNEGGLDRDAVRLWVAIESLSEIIAFAEDLRCDAVRACEHSVLWVGVPKPLDADSDARTGRSGGADRFRRSPTPGGKDDGFVRVARLFHESAKTWYERLGPKVSHS